MPVAGQEARQPEHVAVAGVADDQRAREPALDEADATEDERAHDALPEIGFGHQDLAQLGRRNDDRLDVFQGLRVHQRRAAGQLGQLAHERARTVRDDRLLASERVVLRDRDLAPQDDEHSGADLARRDQSLARAVGATLAEAVQAVDLRGLQNGKHLTVARFDDRAGGCGHEAPTICLFSVEAILHRGPRTWIQPRGCERERRE